MMNKPLAVSRFVIACLFVFPFSLADATMTVTTRSGQTINVAVSRDDIVSISFDDQSGEVSGDSYVIPNDKPVKVTSREALERGRWYVIEARGVVNDWGNAKDGIDAVWCYAEWRCGKKGEAWNQLRIDDKGMNDIAGRSIPYNPEHVYRVRYQGTGRPAVLYMSDAQNSASDNVGALTVRITPE